MRDTRSSQWNDRAREAGMRQMPDPASFYLDGMIIRGKCVKMETTIFDLREVTGNGIFG